MWAWIKTVPCLILGHRWVSVYGPGWKCVDCDATISSVTAMKAKDRFHIGTGVGDG
jgi:hypothetical protein